MALPPGSRGATTGIHSSSGCSSSRRSCFQVPSYLLTSHSGSSCRGIPKRAAERRLFPTHSGDESGEASSSHRRLRRLAAPERTGWRRLAFVIGRGSKHGTRGSGETAVSAATLVRSAGFTSHPRAAEGQQTLKIEPTQLRTNQAPKPAEPHQ